MASTKGLKNLVDLAKKYVLTGADTEVLAKRQRLSTALKVADRLSGASGSETTTRLSTLGAPTLSPMARVKQLSEAGFDVDNPLYYVMRGDIKAPTRSLFTSPEAAAVRHRAGMENAEDLMGMLGVVSPSRLETDPEVVERIKHTAKIYKNNYGLPPDESLLKAIDNEGQSFTTVPVFVRREESGYKPNWYEENPPPSSEDIVSIFGHLDEAGQFARGGVVRKFYRGVDRIAPDNEARFMAYRPWDNPKKTGMVNVPLKAGWVADNPNVASSYAASGPGGVVIPVRMDADPDMVLDAEGANWRDFFKAYVGGSRRSKFYQGMRDPDVKSIEVQNVVDPGTGAWVMLDDIRAQGDEGMSLSDMLNKYYLSNNVLVKDPNVIRYDLSDEPVTFDWMGRDYGR